MEKQSASSLLKLSASAQTALIAGARNIQPVQGLTHNFYKYPARFSPVFVRAAIEAFTTPGDLCIDPHVGGGTTLVEALALGRDAIGVDISALAAFVATVKTTVYEQHELDQLSGWVKRLPESIHAQRMSVHFGAFADSGYYKHLNHPSRWRLRKAIEQAIWSAMRLKSDRLESFGRCVILRTAQWALDGRKVLPSVSQFRGALVENAQKMLLGARQLLAAVERCNRSSTIQIINRSAAGLQSDERFALRPPRLVVTSPPYPGIHVLYHRWQVDGRKETPAPFWIADKLDGVGSSYYTMGDRKHPNLSTYFDNVRATMSSVAALADDNTIVVQMLAFAEPKWQLRRYLETMEEAGLAEAFLPTLEGEGDGRLWRSVPNRRWYSGQRGETPGSSEVVLIHHRRQRA